MFRCSYTIFREITSCVSWSYELLKKYSTAVVILYTVFRNDYRGFNNLYIQYTWDSSICIFLFNRTTLQVFVTYLTGALYVQPLWFYKHQHDNRVRSKLFVACQRWWFQWRFWFVPSVPGYLREEEEHGIVRWWLFPEFGAELPLDNCKWPTFMKCKHTKRLLTAVRRHLSKLRSKRKNA